jgi:hypothetical protein
MEQTTLKYLRVLVPGIICLLGLYPAYRYYLGELYDIKSLDVTYLTLISLILGSIYHQLNIRWLILRVSSEDIDNNILNNLKLSYPGTLTDEQSKFLSGKSRFKSILYRLIDNHESLKKKANNVYFNGIFWSSTADLVLFGAAFGLLYFFAFSSVPDSVRFSKMFFVISGLSLLLHYLSVRTHLKLGDDQFSYINDLLRKEVKEQTDVVLQQMPTPTAVEGSTDDSQNKEGVSKK